MCPVPQGGAWEGGEMRQTSEVALTLTSIAEQHGRNYVTPEDVSEALDSHASKDLIRMEVLALVGRQSKYGIEDAGLCACIAWRGMARAPDLP